MAEAHRLLGKIPFGVTKYIMNDVTAFDTTNRMLEQVRLTIRPNLEVNPRLR